jgi:hypothetical protein
MHHFDAEAGYSPHFEKKTLSLTLWTISPRSCLKTAFLLCNVGGLFSNIILLRCFHIPHKAHVAISRNFGSAKELLAALNVTATRFAKSHCIPGLSPAFYSKRVVKERRMFPALSL